jgi:hypothetical protein
MSDAEAKSNSEPRSGGEAKSDEIGEHTRHSLRDPRQLEAALQHIRQALVGLQFGEVSVVVQDGVVVQVERVERKRFRRGER